MVDCARINYASPNLAPPPSSGLFAFAMGGWAVAAAGGLICTALYAITWRESLLLAGFFWLFAGGLLTLIAIICGALYFSGAKACRFQPPHTKLRARLATLLPLSNVLLAIACVILGISLLSHAEKHFDAIVVNASGVAIDDARIVFSDDRSYSFGPLPIDGTSQTQNVKLSSGAIRLRCRQGDREWEVVAQHYIDEDDIRSNRVREFRIEPPQ